MENFFCKLLGVRHSVPACLINEGTIMTRPGGWGVRRFHNSGPNLDFLEQGTPKLHGNSASQDLTAFRWYVLVLRAPQPFWWQFRCLRIGTIQGRICSGSGSPVMNSSYVGLTRCWFIHSLVDTKQTGEELTWDWVISEGPFEEWGVVMVAVGALLHLNVLWRVIGLFSCWWCL